MISDIQNLLLIKYLRNELTEAETAAVLRWLEESEENMEFLFGLKEAYQLSKWNELKGRSEASNGWEDMQERIVKAEENEEDEKPVWRMKWIRYSAAAVVLLLAGFFVRDMLVVEKPSFNSIETASGQQSMLTLNDGTKIKLNENSRLIYPTAFNEKNRDVSLRGEAYFEVAHNPDQPFLVNIGAYTVKVLGTKFNVDAYPDQVYIYTSLKEGKIQIIDHSEESKILSELEPGTRFSYNRRTGEYFVNSIDKDQIADWVNGQVIIKRQTLEEVVRRLEEKYGYTIELRNNHIAHLTYNITIDKEPIEEILGNIHFITPQVKFSIDKKDKKVILR